MSVRGTALVASLGLAVILAAPAVAAVPPPVSVISQSTNCTLDGRDIDVVGFKNSDTVAHTVGVAFSAYYGGTAPPSPTTTRIAPAGQTVEVRAVDAGFSALSALYVVSYFVDGSPLAHADGPFLSCSPSEVETSTIVSGQSLPVDTCSFFQVNIAPAHGRLTFSGGGHGVNGLRYTSAAGFAGRDYFQTLCGTSITTFFLRLDDIHVIVTAAPPRPVLANTGSPPGTLAILAGLLLATGSLLLLAARRCVR